MVPSIVRRNGVRRHGFVIGPECDCEVVVLVNARLDPRIESRQPGAGVGQAPGYLDVEPGDVP